MDLGTAHTREAAAVEAVAKETEKAAADEVEAAVEAAAVEVCKDLQRFASVWSKLRDCRLEQPIRDCGSQRIRQSENETASETVRE